jgi:nitroimidazol reductase NimA-like FMN-containing flavoprotein (pyridoxamine 5'-phosphate oxidase superfamily)
VEELTREAIDELLREEIVGRIGCHAGGETYVVPIIYAYDGESLYAYSIEGKKIRMMRENPRVAFEVDRYEGPGRWRSAIASGEYEELEGADAERARSLLAEKLSGVARGPRAAPEGAAPVAFRIRIEQITGRRRGR